MNLTLAECQVMNALAKAWSRFLLLPEDHPAERQEFMAAIHQAQSLIALRALRRYEPEYFTGVKQDRPQPALSLR